MFKIILALLFSATAAQAGTYTTYLNLYKPATGDTNYVTPFANGMTTIDTLLGTAPTTYINVTGDVMTGPLQCSSLTVSGNISGTLTGNQNSIGSLTASSGTFTGANSILLPATAVVQFGPTWGAGSLSFNNGATTAGGFTSAVFNSNVGVATADGTVNTPGYRFNDEAGVGIYRPASNTLGFVTNSLSRATINSDGSATFQGSVTTLSSMTVIGNISGNGIIDSGVTRTAGILNTGPSQNSSMTITGSDFSVGGSTFNVRYGGVNIGGAATSTSTFLTVSASTNTQMVPHQQTGVNVHVLGKQATANVLLLDAFNNATGIYGRRAQGSIDNLQPLGADNTIFAVGAEGYRTTSYSALKAYMVFRSAEAWSDTVNGTYIAFFTTPIGGATVTERMRISDNGFVGVGATIPVSKLTVSSGVLTVDGSGAGITTTGDVTAVAFHGSGAGLTGLPGGGDAVLAATQTFTGQNTFTSGVTMSSFTTTNITFPASGTQTSAYHVFTSTEYIIASNMHFSMAHGLGAIPAVISAYVICKDTDLGWTVGDTVLHPGWQSVSDNDAVNWVLWADATNIYGIYGSSVRTLYNYATHAGGSMTDSKWMLIVKAVR